ncbi:MAG TPA: hypothetical protein VKF17_16775 [Isosphaeraceae bacterium]|nr:hypothetical protein [Isosphaeraceae bacterium]
MNDINEAPCYNLHRNEWLFGREPDMPDGPIELYEPTDAGTEDMPPDTDIDVRFRGDFTDVMAAINEIRGETGRFYFSQLEQGCYLGFLNHCHGSVAVVVF